MTVKTMLPVGLPDPGGVAEVTLAVKLIGCPVSGCATELVSPRVTAAFDTVWDSVPVLGLKFVSPE
jgi:hypothetical protein